MGDQPNKAKKPSSPRKQAKGSSAGSIPDRKREWDAITYFTAREFTCKCEGFCDHPDVVSMELVQKLDRIRKAVGVPLKINSGTRCERHNRKTGGASTSAHLPKNDVSYAADVACPNGSIRYVLIREALREFNRIGIAKDFIHVDNDPSLPAEVVWTY